MSNLVGPRIGTIKGPAAPSMFFVACATPFYHSFLASCRTLGLRPVRVGPTHRCYLGRLFNRLVASNELPIDQIN